MAVTVGMSAVREYMVTEADTAVALGSGDVAVLATPRVLAWVEAASVVCLDDVLDDSETSVGTRVELEHLVATPVGAHVSAVASVAHVDGRLVRFEVAVEHRVGTAEPVLAASGRITRVIVDRARFLARL
jgi:predicted thioesterase